MEHLIKITEQDGKQLVSARDLHKFLEVGKDFSTWFKDMLNYGFEEGIDFTPILGKSTGGRPTKEYAITLDMAKEISMLQRSEKGKIARKYFIECEKKAKQPQELTRIELLTMALEAEKKVIELEKTKAQISDKKTATAMATASVAVRKANRLEIQLDQSLQYANIKRVEMSTGEKYKWRKLKEKSEELNKQIKDVPDPNFGTVKAYHYDAWYDQYGIDLKAL